MKLEQGESSHLIQGIASRIATELNEFPERASAFKGLYKRALNYMWNEISESDESIETQDSIENSEIKLSKSDSGQHYFKSKTERRWWGERIRTKE